MIDWMILVLRVMNVSTPKTLFLAISLMDRYFYAKQQEGVILCGDQLHLIGITSMFIASKYEDVYTLRIE